MNISDLLKAGFKKTGDNCYQLFNDYTCTVILPNELYATGLDDVNQSKLNELVWFLNNKQIAIDEILDFIKDNQTDQLDDDQNEPGFDAEDELTNLTLPDIDHNDTRKLIIYTWGRKMRKKQPEASQKNFNAAILNGKRKDVNLKKLDGRSEEVQQVVVKCKMFPSFVLGVVENVEKENLTCISVNCSKGRHRSVAGALLLKKYYYPEAEVIHLEL